MSGRVMSRCLVRYPSRYSVTSAITLRRLPSPPTKLAHLNGCDALYLLGFSGATVALIAIDKNVSNSVTGQSGDRRASRYASNILVGAALGSSTINYLVGCHERNRQRRDDAVREWEAMGFGLGSVGVLKHIFRRERPAPGSTGQFFDSGTSFPSGHSVLATAWAAVLGEEYPGTSGDIWHSGVLGPLRSFALRLGSTTPPMCWLAA